MGWIEEEKNIKILCWGKLKDGVDKNDAVVVKEGESIEGVLSQITPVKDEDEEVSQYKYRLKMKDEKKEVVIWSNASIFRQHENLKLKEGEHIRFTYDGQYSTSFGGKGFRVRVAVDR